MHTHTMSTDATNTHIHILRYHAHALTWMLHLSLTLVHIFAKGYIREPGVITLPWVPLPSLEQLRTQKFWPQNGCLSGMEVSHHSYNQVKPSEYHQCAQQSQGSGFISPRDLSAELICCSGNRILVLHDSDSSQTLKTFPVLNDWLGDTTTRIYSHKRIPTELG